MPALDYYICSEAIADFFRERLRKYICPFDLMFFEYI